MFARARVHNVHTWRVEAALRGCAITSAKVAEEVIAVAQGDLTTLVLTDDNHMQSMSALMNSSVGRDVSCAVPLNVSYKHCCVSSSFFNVQNSHGGLNLYTHYGKHPKFILHATSTADLVN